MKGKSNISCFAILYYNDKLKSHYLEIPRVTMKKLYPDRHRDKARLLCSVNGHKTFQCGTMPLADGKGYITISAKRMKEYGVGVDDRVKVELSYDQSEYGMPMPEELSVYLEQDPEGAQRFNQLTPAKKRYIIYYVNQVKSSQLRIDRSIKVIENLKKTIPGKEDFRVVFGYPPREK